VGPQISLNVNDNLSITATCTQNGQTSGFSDPARISIAINETDCNQNEMVNTQMANQSNIVNSYSSITSGGQILNQGRSVFSAAKKIDLVPGFETKNGVVFKAEIEGCKKLKSRTVIDGLDSSWEILWGSDNNIWFTERGCKIGKVDPNTGIRTLIYTILNCTEDNEGGSLGMVLDPDFVNNHFIYVVNVYSTNYLTNTTFKERLFKCTYNVADNTIGNLVVLLDNIAAQGWHNGSRLSFGPDG
jgi:glucose/arabinose dehydrogenase